MSENKKIYIIPYYNGELNCKISVSDLLVISKGLRKEYPENTEIEIITIKDFGYSRILCNISEFEYANISVSNINTIIEFISFYNSNKDAIIATVGNYLKSGNIIDAQRYLDEANLFDTNKYCIIPMDIKDSKFYRLSFDKLKEVINRIYIMDETISIWCSLKFFNIFKKSNDDYLIKLTEFIEEEFGGKDVYVTISDKSLDEIHANCYKIVCTQNIIDYYKLKYIKPEWLAIIDADTDTQDNIMLPNKKPLMLFPYDEHKKLLPINTIRNIISNIRSKVSKDACIIIRALSQIEFDLLSSTDLRMQDGISILISENYFKYERVIEDGYDIIANKVFIPKNEPFINIESYID